MEYTRFITALIFLIGCHASAEILFLSHFNDSLVAEEAKGNPEPALVGGQDNPGTTTSGGYSFNNSMPAIGGLSLGKSLLAYETQGNIEINERTIGFWFQIATRRAGF